MRGVRLVLTVLVTLAIGVADRLSGDELAWFAFYFAPIAYASWRLGLRPALAIVLLATAIWTTANPIHGAPFGAVWLWNAAARCVAFTTVALTVSRMRSALDREREIGRELRVALDEIQVLRGLLPACSSCRRIRDEDERWVPLDVYLSARTGARFSHGYCPDCYRAALRESDSWSGDADWDPESPADP